MVVLIDLMKVRDKGKLKRLRLKKFFEMRRELIIRRVEE